MRNISFILADDEAIYRELMLEYLSAVPDLTCLRVCENAIQVNQFIQEDQPDVLILDVEMPGLSGLQLVKSLDKQPYTIFISSHPEYAIDAIDMDAVDFIKKPIPPERLMRAMEKVRKLLIMKDALAHQENFKANDANHFFIREDGAFVRVDYEDVLYIESLTDFVKIHLDGGVEKMVLVNLKNLLLQLPHHQFIRISRSHVVNKNRVTAVNKSAVHLGYIQLPTGITYHDSITEAIVGDSFIKRHI